MRTPGVSFISDKEVMTNVYSREDFWVLAPTWGRERGAVVIVVGNRVVFPTLSVICSRSENTSVLFLF